MSGLLKKYLKLLIFLSLIGFGVHFCSLFFGVKAIWFGHKFPHIK